jgi:hypothetical protein
MPDLDPSTEYILVQVPHRGNVFTCSGTPDQIISIITANGRTHITEYTDDEDWSSYGDGTQPEWFKGAGWYYKLTHHDEPTGPVTCQQAITEIAGRDHNSVLLLTREQATAHIASDNTEGHRGIEILNALRTIMTDLCWIDVRCEVTFDKPDSESGTWDAHGFDPETIIDTISQEYTGDLQNFHIHLYTSSGGEIRDDYRPTKGRFRISRQP